VGYTTFTALLHDKFLRSTGAEFLVHSARHRFLTHVPGQQLLGGVLRLIERKAPGAQLRDDFGAARLGLLVNRQWLSKNYFCEHPQY
jgi:hypothetical protein